MNPCCLLNLYISLHSDTVHQVTTSSHEDNNTVQIRKSKGSLNPATLKRNHQYVRRWRRHGARCTVHHIPATVLVSVPVPYLHAIKGLARKPTPRRVQPGDHARRELLPYLPTCPPLSPPFKSTCAASSHPVRFPSWSFSCQLNIVQLSNLVIDCRAHTYKYPYLILDTRISRQVLLLRCFVLSKSALCAQPKQTAPRSPSPPALN